MRRATSTPGTVPTPLTARSGNPNQLVGGQSKPSQGAGGMNSSMQLANRALSISGSLRRQITEGSRGTEMPSSAGSAETRPSILTARNSSIGPTAVPTTQPISTSARIEGRSYMYAPVPSASSQNSQDDGVKRSRADDEDINFEGMYEVALAKNRQLQGENGKLQLRLSQIQQSIQEKVNEALAQEKAALQLRERELEEEREIFRRARIEASTVSTEEPKNNSGERISTSEREDPKKTLQVIAFLEEVKIELVILIRYQGKDGESTGLTSSSNGLVSTASPLALRRVQFSQTSGVPTPPKSPIRPRTETQVTPLSVTSPVLNNGSFMVDRMDLDGREAFNIATNLYEALASVQTMSADASALIGPLQWFLKTKSVPLDIILCAVKVMHVAARVFQAFREHILRNDQIIELVLDRLLDGESNTSIDVQLMLLLKQLALGKLHEGDKTSLKTLSSLTDMSGAFRRKVEKSDHPLVQGTALDLLAVLLQKGSDAVPEGFPVEEDTWKRVSPPFSATADFVVSRCSSLIASNGKDAARFLMHHGISRLIEHMYNCEMRRQPSIEALHLIYDVIRMAGIEATTEDLKKLMICLMSLREMRAPPGSLVTPHAEFIIKHIAPQLNDTA